MKIYKFIAMVLVLVASLAFAQNQNDQPYVIGVDDVLSITFWQEPDLNTDSRVHQDGKITLPVVGDIQAAGLTASELSKNIVKQMAFYNPGINQATVNVTSYNSKVVVISGAVNTPGQYHFEKIPNILGVIREAGGALPDADLSSVTIIRQSGEKVDVIDVDLLKYIKSGDLSKMPPLMPKDMINVPLSPYGVTAELMSSRTFEGKNIYFIYGAVGEPGVKPLTDDVELLDAIAAAGGTTDAADLKNVRVVMKDVGYSSVLKINLNKYTETGRPERYTLKPEDTIYIPYRSTNASFLSRLPELLLPAAATTVITTLIINALQNNSN
jgi:polysaccharide biosynthesis/export protein